MSAWEIFFWYVFLPFTGGFLVSYFGSQWLYRRMRRRR